MLSDKADEARWKFGLVSQKVKDRVLDLYLNPDTKDFLKPWELECARYSIKIYLMTDTSLVPYSKFHPYVWNDYWDSSKETQDESGS